jgi:branched-chain amino acid transport system substrate-binding protein
MLTAVLAAVLADAEARAAADQVVIGDIDDMSSLYSDISGTGSIEAVKMAIDDFGGKALGKPIQFLSADHQNKPDVGGSKFREWADQNGLTVLLGGANTGVNIAMAKAAAEKKTPFFPIGAAGSSLTNADCTPFVLFGYAHLPKRGQGRRHNRRRRGHG